MAAFEYEKTEKHTLLSFYWMMSRTLYTYDIRVFMLTKYFDANICAWVELKLSILGKCIKCVFFVSQSNQFRESERKKTKRLQINKQRNFFYIRRIRLSHSQIRNGFDRFPVIIFVFVEFRHIYLSTNETMLSNPRECTIAHLQKTLRICLQLRRSTLFSIFCRHLAVSSYTACESQFTIP